MNTIKISLILLSVASFNLNCMGGRIENNSDKYLEKTPLVSLIYDFSKRFHAALKSIRDETADQNIVLPRFFQEFEVVKASSNKFKMSKQEEMTLEEVERIIKGLTKITSERLISCRPLSPRPESLLSLSPIDVPSPTTNSPESISPVQAIPGSYISPSRHLKTNLLLKIIEESPEDFGSCDSDENISGLLQPSSKSGDCGQWAPKKMPILVESPSEGPKSA